MTARSGADVLLVSMPFGPLLQPSIGLSLLKAGLTERGVTAKVLYFTMPFAKLTGAPSYIRRRHHAIVITGSTGT